MVVPKDWNDKTIDSFPVRVVSGGTPNTFITEYWNGNIPWMNSGELNLKRVYSVEGRITLAGLNNSSTCKIPENSILIGLAGQGKTRGTVAITYIELCTNQSIASILPNPDIFDSEFLYQNLNNRYNELRELSTGDGGRGGLNLTVIRQLKVLFPPLAEQHAIALALSETDELINSLEKLIAKKRAIKQGTMQELLTGKRRLPGFNGEWTEKPFCKIADEIIMGQSPDSRYYNTTRNGLPLIQGNADLENRLTKRRFFTSVITKLGSKDDIVLTVRAPVGYVAKAKFDCCLGRGVCAIKGNNFLFQLLVYFEPNWGAISTGSTFDSISGNDLREIMFFIPKDIYEQNAIAQILSDMDAEIDILTSKLNKLRYIKQGMMSELLTGRIRLINSKQAEATQIKVKSVQMKIKKVKEKPVEKSENKVIGHNKPIEDAVILAVVTDLYATPEYPLAPFYSQKFPYLLHRHMEGVAKGYQKLAAGPYNFRLKYKTALPIAIKNNYIITKKGNYKGRNYVNLLVGENIEEAKRYFSQWHGNEPIKWLEQFRYIKNRRDELELLTTVDMAIVELQQNEKSITVETIKEIIQNSDEWRAKLKREIFSDENIARAIKWSNDLFGGNENAKN